MATVAMIAPMGAQQAEARVKIIINFCLQVSSAHGLRLYRYACGDLNLDLWWCCACTEEEDDELLEEEENTT